MSGLLCAGDIYVDRLDSQGNSTGLRWIGNATQFQIQESTEKKTRQSKGRGTYGQSLDTVQIKQPAALSMTLDEVDTDNLALALLGTVATVSVNSGTASNATATAQAGHWVELDHANIDDTSLDVKDQTGTTTYVEGTDYVANYHLGMLKTLAGGSITDGEQLKLSYSYGGVEGSRVAGGDKPIIRARILVDGKNLANGDWIKVDIDKTTLTPSSGVDFLSDEFVPLEMEGEPTTLPGKTSPYSVAVIKPAGN